MKSSSQSRRKRRSQEGVKYGEIESFLCLRRSSASFILCSRPSLKEEESAWFPIIIALNSSGLKKYSYRHVFKATAMHYLVKPVGKNIIAAALAPSALYVKNPEKVQNCQKKIRQTAGRGNLHCF